MYKRYGGGIIGWLLLAGCGGVAGEAIRPKDFTASGATGAGVTCGGTPRASSPLVVDLDPDTRVYLESALSKGVTVVSYDCKSLKVLRGCTMPSTPYEYEGVSRKEDLLRLKSQDDLSVNLPLSAGKLGADMSAGRTLDLALIRVGLKSTTVSSLDRSSLRGNCEGATHYLTSVVVGAFAMTTGSGGKVSAASDLFKIGVSGQSESARQASTHDGTIESCRTSTTDDKAPPEACRSALKLELEPIAEAPTAAKRERKEGEDDKKHAASKAIENPCPQGYAFAGGLCTKLPTPAHLCVATDEADCAEQCKNGSAESCFNLALHMDSSDRTKQKAIVELFKKSCDLGFAEGCGVAASELSPYEVKKSNLGKFRDAIKYARIGCDAGDGRACWELGELFSAEPDPPLAEVTPDLAGAVKVYERGCRLGDSTACSYAANRYSNGQGVPKDPPRALALLERACAANLADICMEMALGIARGSYGAAPDAKRGFEVAMVQCKKEASWCDDAYDIAVINKESDEVLYDMASRHCTAESGGASGNGTDPNGCMKVAKMLNEGRGTTKDAEKARALYATICSVHEFVDACTAAGGGKKTVASPKPKTSKTSKTKR